MDQNVNDDREIGIGGIETTGLRLGPAYPIFVIEWDLVVNEVCAESKLFRVKQLGGTFALIL